MGQQQLGVLFNNTRVDLSCFVTNFDVQVLGLPSCKALNVVKLVNSLNMGILSSVLTETSVGNLVSKYESVLYGNWATSGWASYINSRICCSGSSSRTLNSIQTQ